MAGTDPSSAKPAARSSSSGQKLGASPPPPPYSVAIVAVQHDLVPYAETVEKLALGGGNVEEDHTFLAPSRNMASSLCMLADSQIPSTGELHEIATLRNTLYPPTSVGNSATQMNSAVDSIDTNQAGPSTNTSRDANDHQTLSRLTGALPNPAIQQALDTLMMIPANQYP
ncbi:hypothetical protein FBUS_00605 [Fasciolopsis buskii]|uniref:Uncharacterized protein n=1 Tax=Fasciolopsis buskii TaxID=27845 RepID=A0A8E0VG67_9TREM|nr:hypothetical protein FBUS_00605 [Fasciolopsis buski]